MGMRIPSSGYAQFLVCRYLDFQGIGSEWESSEVYRFWNPLMKSRGSVPVRESTRADPNFRATLSRFIREGSTCGKRSLIPRWLEVLCAEVLAVFFSLHTCRNTEFVDFEHLRDATIFFYLCA